MVSEFPNPSQVSEFLMLVMWVNFLTCSFLIGFNSTQVSEFPNLSQVIEFPNLFFA